MDHNPNTNAGEKLRVEAAGGRIEKMNWQVASVGLVNIKCTFEWFSLCSGLINGCMDGSWSTIMEDSLGFRFLFSCNSRGERNKRVLSYDSLSGLAMTRAFGDFNFPGVSPRQASDRMV